MSSQLSIAIEAAVMAVYRVAVKLCIEGKEREECEGEFGSILGRHASQSRVTVWFWWEMEMPAGEARADDANLPALLAPVESAGGWQGTGHRAGHGRPGRPALCPVMLALSAHKNSGLAFSNPGEQKHLAAGRFPFSYIQLILGVLLKFAFCRGFLPGPLAVWTRHTFDKPRQAGMYRATSTRAQQVCSVAEHRPSRAPGV